MHLDGPPKHAADRADAWFRWAVPIIHVVMQNDDCPLPAQQLAQQLLKMAAAEARDGEIHVVVDGKFQDLKGWMGRADAGAGPINGGLIGRQPQGRELCHGSHNNAGTHHKVRWHHLVQAGNKHAACAAGYGPVYNDVVPACVGWEWGVGQVPLLTTKASA